MDPIWYLPVLALAAGAVVVGILAHRVALAAHEPRNAVDAALGELHAMDQELTRVAPHLAGMSRLGVGRAMARRVRRRAVPSTS